MANIFKAKTLVSRTGIFSHEAIAPNLVYNTGYQNIDGTKNFYHTPTINGDGILSSGQDIIGGDLTGDLLSATINKLQGYPLSINSPSAGQTLIYNGETWVPGANANGGGGGGGKVYYFNFGNHTGIAPSGGLPTNGYHALSLLGRAYDVGTGEFTSPDLTPKDQFHLVTHFVSASGDPGVKNIPAGLWDFNIWANTNTTNATQTQMKAVVNIYDPINSSYRYVSESDAVFLYDNITPSQYILNVTMPQTGIQDYERIYIQLFGQKTTNPTRTITFYFDSYRPSHVHTTIPSVAGSGVVKVIDGIYQTPASAIVDVDVDNNANIQQSKIQNLTTDLASLNSQCSVLTTNLINTGSILNEKINSLSGVSVLTFGDQTISGNKTFANSTTFGDTNQEDFLVISGNNFTVYGSGNFTSGLFVNGNAVLTGVNLSSYATTANLALTGSTLDTKINNLSGVSVLTFGDQNISGNKNFLNNISVSGTGFFNAIDLNNIDTLSLSGVNISIVDGTISLTNRPNINGTGVVLSGELNSTGIFLNNKINSLSGYVNSQDLIFSGQIASTGSNLTNSINSLSGASVLLYGNQTISGIKTFAENAVFGDPSQGDFLVISGNTFTIYGSGNFTNGLFVSGVPVLTGLPNWYATSVNLASTGLVLNNKINSLSGVSVLTFGNQDIYGTKNFAHTGVFGTFNTNYPKLISNPLSVIGSGDTFVQLNIQNFAIGSAASSDLVLTSNAGTDDSFYIDLGINNSGYNQAAYNIGSSGDGYLYVHGGNLTIGTQSPNRTIKFHTDGTTSANQIAEINSTGYFSPNKAVTALSGFFGRNNTYIGADITMGGGENNRISGDESVIAGGFNNRITGNFSNINGGCFNAIRGTKNTIGGGENNRIGVRSVGDFGYISTTLFNFIGGGSGNVIPPHHCSNVIVGGRSNCVISAILPFVVSHNNSILGGELNIIGAGSSQHTSILGGCCNTISTCGSTIVGGWCNFAVTCTSTIAYGANNTGVSIGSERAIFIGGQSNRIDSSSMSAILGGCDNKLYGNCSSIIGGHSNTLGSWSSRVGNASFIGGGGFNIITGTQGNCTTTSEYSLIVGGYANKITSCYSSILGGRQNLVTHLGATVIGDGGARDKISRGVCSLSLDFNGGIFLTGSNITLSPSPLPGRVDFCDSNLINATPNILNVNTNFSIGAGYNSRVVLANSGSMLTGTINLGNPTGFNSSIIQIGVGEVQITGAAGVIIQTYNNQFKTAGQYATISLLHSGNNGYIMYGNTA